jgi:hypothetical protein
MSSVKGFSKFVLASMVALSLGLAANAGTCNVAQQSSPNTPSKCNSYSPNCKNYGTNRSGYNSSGYNGCNGGYNSSGYNGCNGGNNGGNNGNNSNRNRIH